MQAARRSTPRPRQVLLEQVSAVGLALRWPAVATTTLVVLATLLITIDSFNAGQVIAFHPEHHVLPGVMGLLLPIGVWRGEERFGASLFWTLPVDRRQHALVKVFAGWAWLMGGVALFVLWLLALTVLSGGNILAEETRRVLTSFSFSPSRPLDPAALRTVRWTAEPLFWLVPFTAATGTYLLASALALGIRYPLRWIGGMVLGTFLLLAVADATNAVWEVEHLLDALFEGPYGFDALLTARTAFLRTEATLSAGETVVVWRALPTLEAWATATFLWMGAGLVTLWAAASRHRESRRA
jgi:hypothetical protein